MMPCSPRIAAALAAATDTRAFSVDPGALEQAPALFERHFEQPLIIVADPNTFAAAGRVLLGHCSAAHLPCLPPFLLEERAPHADDTTLERVRDELARSDAIAVAVGSGTINDLCKRASFELNRPYMVVGTAASMDGYTSFGAPITQQGFKKTLPCNAPRVVLSDTRVLAKAPAAMTAAGYADLAAKITGGSDWILADAIGADPIRPDIWEMTQTPLRDWLSNPHELADGAPERLEALFEGLSIIGFAMQAMQSSRPASGAEHLFAHVWEMTGLTDPDGKEPSHGFKVGIGTLAVTALTESLFATDFSDSDIEGAVAQHPDWADREAFIRELFQDPTIRDRILEESHAKHLSRNALRDRLKRLVLEWSSLRRRVTEQLLPFDRLRVLLRQAGCPTQPEAIGVSSRRLAATALAAQMIRSRYTVLDLAAETGRLPLLAAQLADRFSRESSTPGHPASPQA